MTTSSVTTSYAGQIAAKLQAAHAARNRNREGRSMTEDIWTTQLDRVIELLSELRATHPNGAADHRESEREVLRDAYVAREVPWSAVAPGMMTIARDGTPWMVERWAGAVPRVVLRNGERAFTKTPADGETVRVLVPYVTPEQAEELVRTELGGRA